MRPYNKRDRIKAISPDPPTFFENIEPLFYEIKPGLLLLVAYWASNSPAASLGFGRLSIILLFGMAMIIVFSRLVYRGYLK